MMLFFTFSFRNVFYSFLTTQESHVALEILMNATLNKEIPLSAVPALMVLSSKVTDMTDHTQLHVSRSKYTYLDIDTHDFWCNRSLKNDFILIRFFVCIS